jgi:hypothetical protein
MPTSQDSTLDTQSSQKVKDGRKRLLSTRASTSSSSGLKPPPHHFDDPIKKLGHRIIEKRYRNNLNDKIAVLRDSVPGLRLQKKTLPDCDAATMQDGPQSSDDIPCKLNKVCSLHAVFHSPVEKKRRITHGLIIRKATIFTEATKYIRHLEKQNAGLAGEHQALRDRIMAFEILLMSGSLRYQHPG